MTLSAASALSAADDRRWLSSLASAHGTPVYITVWDLLPPSRWATLSRTYLGVGVFHTNVWLPDLRSEFAYGGHDVPDITGVFAMPCCAEAEAAAGDAQAQSAEEDDDPDGAVRRRRTSMRSAPPPLQTQEGPLDDGLTHRYPAPDLIPPRIEPPFPGCRYIGAYFMGYAGAPASSASSPSISGGSALRSASAPDSADPEAAEAARRARYATMSVAQHRARNAARREASAAGATDAEADAAGDRAAEAAAPPPPATPSTAASAAAGRQEAEREQGQEGRHAPGAMGGGTLLRGMSPTGRWLAGSKGARSDGGDGAGANASAAASASAQHREPALFVPPSILRASRRANGGSAAAADAGATLRQVRKKGSGWFGLGALWGSAGADEKDAPERSAPSVSAPEAPAVAAGGTPSASAAYRDLPRHPSRTGVRARSVLHAHKAIAELKASPRFRGANYDLLSNNCNHFAEELLQRLLAPEPEPEPQAAAEEQRKGLQASALSAKTKGKRPDSPAEAALKSSVSASSSAPPPAAPAPPARKPILPAWINRAAWLGSEVQRVVPLSTIEKAVMLVVSVDNTDAPGAGGDAGAPVPAPPAPAPAPAPRPPPSPSRSAPSARVSTVSASAYGRKPARGGAEAKAARDGAAHLKQPQASAQDTRRPSLAQVVESLQNEKHSAEGKQPAAS